MRFRFELLLLGGVIVFAQAGKSGYMARCVGCHGEDGSGGGHGPGILSVRTPKATTRALTAEVIRNGIPGVGMPAFPLPAAELEAIADFTWGMKGARGEERVTGDAAAGGKLFAGKCVGCHIVRGKGGVLGPDLSTVGRDRTVAQLRESLKGGKGESTTVTLRDGRVVKGIVKNWSPFDSQVLDMDGQLHLLRREQIATSVNGPSPMAAVTEGAADLVAYLSTLREAPEVAVGATLGAGVSFEAVARPRAGEWPSYNGSLDGNRFSCVLDMFSSLEVEVFWPT